MALKITPETRLKHSIKSLFKMLNIWSFPITQGLGSYPGIPDRFVPYKGTIYVIEAKSPKGKQSEHQLNFQKRWEFHYKATYILAYSVDDVIDGMGLRDKFI